MRSAAALATVLLLLSLRPVSATDCAEHGACCFPRANPYPTRAPLDAPPRDDKRIIAALTVRGALSRPNVRRVLAGVPMPGCSDVVTLVIAPAGAVESSCAALRALRFPAAGGVTEVGLTLATPTASAP